MNSESGKFADQTMPAAARAALEAHFSLPGSDRAAATAWASLQSHFAHETVATCAGVQVVVAGLGELPFKDCPVEWLDRPFARVRWFQNDAGGHPGKTDAGTWALDLEQEGTVLIELVESYRSDFNAVPTPADILADLAGSAWLQNAMQEALKRDPVDAANDAAVLARVLAQRVHDAVTAARPA